MLTSLQQRSKNIGKNFGLAHKAQIAGVRTVHTAFTIVTKQMLAFDVLKVFDAVFQQTLVGSFQLSSVFLMVVLHATGDEECVLHGAILHQYNGRVRMSRCRH